MPESGYECPECDGSGWTECEWCGHEEECQACDGTGLDGDKIDLAAFVLAEDELAMRGGAMTWEWAEGEKELGRQNGVGRVAYADFKVKEAT